MTDTHSYGTMSLKQCCTCWLAHCIRGIPLCFSQPQDSLWGKENFVLIQLICVPADSLSCMYSTVLVALSKCMINALVLIVRVKFNWRIGRVHMCCTYMSAPHSSTGNQLPHDNGSGPQKTKFSLFHHPHITLTDLTKPQIDTLPHLQCKPLPHKAVGHVPFSSTGAASINQKLSTASTAATLCFLTSNVILFSKLCCCKVGTMTYDPSSICEKYVILQTCAGALRRQFKML